MIKLEDFEKMVSYRLTAEVTGSVGVEASLGGFTGNGYLQVASLPDDLKNSSPDEIIKSLQRQATVNLHAQLAEAFEPGDYEELRDITQGLFTV